MDNLKDFKPYPDYISLNGKEVKYLLEKIESSCFKPTEVSSIRVETSMIGEIYGGPHLPRDEFKSDLHAFILDLEGLNIMKKYFDGKKDEYPSSHVLKVCKDSKTSTTLIGKTYKKIGEMLNISDLDS